MKRKMKQIIALLLVSIFIFAGCSSDTGSTVIASTDSDLAVNQVSTAIATTTSTETASDEGSEAVILLASDSLLNTEAMFTDRDLEQSADLSEASSIVLESGKDVSIADEGVYVISGTVENTTIIVEAAEDAKVQLVLDGVSITNEDAPAIYVKSADKVFVTTTDSDNYMETSGYFSADGDTNLDAVIFSRSDLVLNGLGSLEILSVKGNGIASKDDLKVTGGTYAITAADDGMEANDSVRIYDGEINIVANKDAIHSENDDDSSLGYIYIQGGLLNLASADDAIRGTGLVQIDGGTITIETCTEGIEGTTIQINGGDIDIYSTDDGVNAAAKSPYDVAIQLNGGNINVVMASGDTDAFDSNGVIYINGSTINAEGGSIFDANGSVEFNAGDITINGEVVTDISQIQMMGGGGGRHH